MPSVQSAYNHQLRSKAGCRHPTGTSSHSIILAIVYLQLLYAAVLHKELLPRVFRAGVSQAEQRPRPRTQHELRRVIRRAWVLPAAAAQILLNVPRRHVPDRGQAAGSAAAADGTQLVRRHVAVGAGVLVEDQLDYVLLAHREHGVSSELQ